MDGDRVEPYCCCHSCVTDTWLDVERTDGALETGVTPRDSENWAEGSMYPDGVLDDPSVTKELESQ